MDVNRQNVSQADQHFKLPNHNYVNIDKDSATLRLKKREDFLVQKLKILHPYGLNAELNFFPTNNQKSSYLFFWYMSTNVIFSADETLTLWDIGFKYLTFNL